MSFELPTPTAPLANPLASGRVQPAPLSSAVIAPYSAGRPADATRVLHTNLSQRRRVADAQQPLLNTFEAISHHLLGIAERIERLRADYYIQNGVAEVTEIQLNHMRAVGLALLIHTLDQTHPGQGARVARALFPDDVWVPGDDADIHNAITRPAELGPVL